MVELGVGSLAVGEALGVGGAGDGVALAVGVD
jgi:hypothetical protein